MARMTSEEKEAYRKAIANRIIKDTEQGDDGTYKHWRAWGSWFSWGSPVGLGIFLVTLAIAVWIFAQIP